MTGVVSPVSSRAVQVVIGVDTHRDQHVAVAIDGRGVRLGENHVPATIRGYEELERWWRSLGEIRAFTFLEATRPDDIRMGDPNDELVDFLAECNIDLRASYSRESFSRCRQGGLVWPMP